MGNIIPFPIDQARPRFVFSRALIHRLVERAAEITGISREELVGKSRLWDVAYTRFAIVQVAHESGRSLSQIARALGYRDHTSALHACRRAPGLESSDADFAELVRALRQEARG
jgi:chromosomal replication initiation ATPase DnaA